MRGTGTKTCTKPAPPVKSVSGSGGAVDCKECRDSKRSTERMITLGLKVIRLRFGIHRSELPDLGPKGLKYYLLSLLNPGESIRTFSDGLLRGFPRAGLGYDDDGFPRLRRLSRSDRWELAHSCNSLARSLPPSCRKHTPSTLDAWVATATTPSPPAPSDYLRFVRKTVSRLFPLGWDRQRYPQSVYAFAPKASKRAESEVACAALNADDFWSSEYGPRHPEYVSTKPSFSTFCLTGRWNSPWDYCDRSPADRIHTQKTCANFLRGKHSLCERCERRARLHFFGRKDIPGLPQPGGFFLRVKDIPTVGKTRTIGIPSLNYDVLGPMHKAIYGHLTTKDWLMHGTVTSERIEAVCKGSIQTSVDLVNATDGLNLEVTEAILGSILRKSVSIPGFLKEAAFHSLRPEITEREGDCGLYDHFDRSLGRISHGQMMGTYLSFPLLCLHSYCAGLWAARSSHVRGILVNGDDTIISHDSPLGEYPPGYVKNELKTLTSPKTCELNSTVFMLRSGRWKEIRNLRRFGAESDFLGFRHMAGACQRASPSWVTAFMRSRIGKSWALSSKDLELDPSHRLVWLRDRRRRGAGSNFVFPSLPRDERYDLVSEPLSIADQVAFGLDLFSLGRSEGPDKYPNGPSDLLNWNPPRSRVLRSCGKPRPVRRTLAGRTFGSEHTYEFVRDYPRSPPQPDTRCKLNPDSYWAQAPRQESLDVLGSEGRYILSPCVSTRSASARSPLVGGSRALDRETELEQVVKIRCYDTGLGRWFGVSPREVIRDLIETSGCNS
nr:MAG: hypothetical protein [Botourmiaviridae sp.]